jgi:hypothetical protein
MKKTLQKIRGKGLAILLALALTLTLLPVSALADGETITVRIVGENSVILDDVSVNIADVTDLTTNEADSSSNLNALDAVLYATRRNGYDWSEGGTPTYSISYSVYMGVGSYYISKLVNITPSGAYWATLAVISGGHTTATR